MSAFASFGGVPLSVLYDNLKNAAAKICGDGERERTRAFTELASHCLFSDRFGRPSKGNDKGKVEGLVKYASSYFMTPIPLTASFDDLNVLLTKCCLARLMERAGRHTQTIGARLAPILVRSGTCPPWRWSPARSGPPASRRRRWCAIGATTARCRPAMAYRR